MIDCIESDALNVGAYTKVLTLIAKSKKNPLFAQFELTAKCNFNCRMCYIHMTDQQINKIGKELTTQEWLHIAREAKDLGVLYLSLSGGEVFTRPDFKELYEELSKMGFLIQIMSNISMIDENVMDWLSNSPPFQINTTIYGSNNDVYRSVCGIENGFDRFDRALTLLQDAHIPVAIKSVLIKNNEHDVLNMVKYAAQHGIILNTTFGVNKPVRGAVSDAEKVRRTIDKPAHHPDVTKLKPHLENHGPYLHHPNYLDDCSSYETGITVTWDGHLVLCSFMAEPFIDLRDHCLAEAWPSLLSELSSKVKKPEKCVSCKYEEYCLRCPGVLSAECGSYLLPSNEFCNRAKYLYNLYNGEDKK